MIGALFKKLAGRHYKKFLKETEPLVQRINALEEEYQQLSDDALRAKTDEFKARYREAVEIAERPFDGAPESDEKRQAAVKEANDQILEELLPEAFAVVKNTARRLCGQQIMVCGQEMAWEMVHFDVQLIGGIALHRHMIAEMATGEGKTLVATLPLYLNALSGRNCQLVTTNEFLAQRDSEWMGYVYRFLGLTVGCIKGGHVQRPSEKREMYACDITYGTASEFGFDYLRDNGMVSRKEDQVQRDHFYVIIDEVDSILIDEARTPLIISGPAQQQEEMPFMQFKPVIEKLTRQQMNFCNRLVDEAGAILKKGEAGPEERLEAMEKLFVVKQGAPKNRQFTRLLEDNALRQEFEKFDLEMQGDYNRARKYALKEELLYTLDEKQHNADLTEKGRAFLRPDDPDGFVLPDLPLIYTEIDRDTARPETERQKAKAEAQQQYEKTSEEIHTIGQLLRAYSLYERDVEYVVQEGKVMIVDENTGRVMPGRRWSDGLHQAVEAKEGVAIEKETKTYASITIQNHFRMYQKLAGMTGTAETEANEFQDIYGLRVMVIPTNRPNIRADENDIIFKTEREKYNAVIADIREAHDKGRPVLVGTTSVDTSEKLHRLLQRAKIPHAVLNAKYHAQEAEIVARAGQRGAVTISTNMAGRGTDIKLGEGIQDLGGLYVMGTERHTSRRIDRQLRGRCARQGDPGTSRFFLSLEDNLMRLYGQSGLAGKMLQASFEEGQPLEHAWLNPAIERAQKTVEQHHYSIRKRLLQYDDVLNQQREVIYGIRNDAIHSEAPGEIIWELVEEELDFRMEEAGWGDPKAAPDEDSRGEFVKWISSHFPIGIKDDQLTGKAGPEVRESLLQRIREAYELKCEIENEEMLPAIERMVVIQAIDRHWQDHLTEMEDLRQSVGLRSYGQKDPLNEYKSEAFNFFDTMMGELRGSVCAGLFRTTTNPEAYGNLLVNLNRRARTIGPTDGVPSMTAAVPAGGAGGQPAAVAAGGGAGVATASGGGSEVRLPKVAPPRRRDQPKVGRNDPCPCGSGKKYKKCCFPKYE